MKIAIPIAQGQLAAHFGHCEQFVIVEVADSTKEIVNMEYHTPPAHEPGVLPVWLAQKGANVIVAGGMGSRAQQLFTQHNIKVVVGAASDKPETLVSNFLNNTLESGQNLCDH